MTWTILASINLLCAVLSYSFLAYALAHLRWRRRGIFLVLLAIFFCAQVWLIPQAIASFSFRWNIALYPMWFGNWLISAFSIVLFSQRLQETSRDLADAARMDGCGALGIYWHVVLPLVRRALLLLAVLTLMATWMEFAAPLLGLNRLAPQPPFISMPVLIIGSLVMTSPLIAIFLFMQRCSRDR